MADILVGRGSILTSYFNEDLCTAGVILQILGDVEDCKND
jgi:hypothetical protein